MHGYDWESKAGSLERFFHPKNALNLNSKYGYGQIVEYYTTTPDAPYDPSYRTMEEDIADGYSQMEYVNFDENENYILSCAIASIDNSVLKKFAKYYALWKYVTENTIYSSPYQMAECDEYKNTLNYCREHPELLNVLYKNLDSNDWAALKLVEDLTLYNEGNMQILRTNAKPVSTQKGIKTYRTPISNCIAYIKTLLKQKSDNILLTKTIHATSISGIYYSNSNDINITPTSNGINVTFNLKKHIKCHIKRFRHIRSYHCNSIEQ